MLEDFLYEIIPVIGFAMCASSSFILIVMRKATCAFQTMQYFAVVDLIAGMATIYSGFHGVVITIYGNTGEISSFYLNWKVICVLALLSCGSLIPAFTFPFENMHNSSVHIPSLCRFDEVVGSEYYLAHVLAMQWVPIAGVGLLALTLIIYAVRQTRQKWSYNWSENNSHTKQLFATAFLRCFLAGVSVHVPLLFVSRSPKGSEMETLKDFLIRLSYYIIVPILQPLWYVFIMPEFHTNISMLFNQYSYNTERKWQSADDPPREPHHVDIHGDVNPFGSWYSTTGNIAGEAGVPVVGNERSISFYYENEK
uniref:G_PROTEIN_RECEP_F1_2 domain-containing protein n=1 Tax=Heterorhabditis bacteriophora TaxID=37862 RepID=A0A1I7XDN5_HETBA